MARAPDQSSAAGGPQGCSSERSASTGPDNLGDLAAALTYYGVLAIFPILIVLVSRLGPIEPLGHQSLIHNRARRAGRRSSDLHQRDPEHPVLPELAGILFIAGLADTLWSSSSPHCAAYARLECRLGRRGGPAFLQDHLTAPGGFGNGCSRRRTAVCGRLIAGSIYLSSQQVR